MAGIDVESSHWSFQLDEQTAELLAASEHCRLAILGLEEISEWKDTGPEFKKIRETLADSQRRLWRLAGESLMCEDCDDDDKNGDDSPGDDPAPSPAPAMKAEPPQRIRPSGVNDAIRALVRTKGAAQ